MRTPWTINVAPASHDDFDEDEENFPSNRSDTTVGDREIELKGDQFEEMTDSKLKLNVFDLWALGITTALGGHCYLWNLVLGVGFGNFIVAFFLIASAYGCLLLCMAELSGALPFAGGAYGIARVTLGSLPGYLIACFDSYQSMFYTMLSVLILGIMITLVADTDAKWQPLWWFLIYASYLVVHCVGGLFFWRTMRTLSLGSLLLLVVYILGSIKFANFEQNAALTVTADAPEMDRWFQSSALRFFQILPLPCWFFIGVESLNLASHDAVEPKRDVPRAYVASYLTICCTALCVIFVACAVPPGVPVLQFVLSPLSFGYMLMFDIDYFTASILSMPAIYTSGFGFTYYYGSQVRAMGKSGLANSWLGYDAPYFNTPVPALLFGAAVGYCVGLRYHFYRALKHEDIFSVALLGAVLTYFSQFFSFIAFRLYYPTIRREFVSPLGIAGAVYGMLVFGVVLVVLLGLEASVGIIAFAIYMAILLLYYYTVVIKRQVFSEEEKTVLFKAYLMKANRLKAGRVRVGQARVRSRAYGSSPHHSGSTGSHEKHDSSHAKEHVAVPKQDDGSVSLYSAASGGSGTHRIYSGNAVSMVRAFYGAGSAHKTEGSEHSSDKTVSLRFQQQQKDQQPGVGDATRREFLPLSTSEETAVGATTQDRSAQVSDPSLAVVDWAERTDGAPGGSGIEMV